MLNTKYVIYNPQAAPLQNYSTFGNAWFSDNITWFKNANEEIDALNDTNLKTEIVVDERFKSFVGELNPFADSSATVLLTSYAPNKLTYQSKSDKEQVVVFSKVYYPNGWKVSIDGEEVDHFRANYILRAVMVPAGNHTIVFSFEPESFVKGQKIVRISSIILLLLILAAIGQKIYSQREKTA